MKNKRKIISGMYKLTMKILPACAMLMAIMNVNATACWFNGQETPPANLRQYRKF